MACLFRLFCDFAVDIDAFGVDEDEEMRCIKIQEVIKKFTMEVIFKITSTQGYKLRI